MSSHTWVKDQLASIIWLLTLGQDITRLQPPQEDVVNNRHRNTTVFLLTTPQLSLEYNTFRQQLGPTVPPSELNSLRSFRFSERYQCFTDRPGQVRDSLGFFFRGWDLCEHAKVVIKVFHKPSDAVQIATEIDTWLHIHRHLRPVANDPNDVEDLLHLSKLRDVLVDEPIMDYRRGSMACTGFRATALVFDWVEGRDAESMVSTSGGVTPATGARLFRQLLHGLRALHRRGIVHRDIKPQNILITHDRQNAYLCNFKFAKYVPSVKPADLTRDPTSCYQSPERWLACDSRRAARARSTGLVDGDGPDVSRQDESPSSLFAGDIFSAGVILFVLVAGTIMEQRAVHPAMASNVFQYRAHNKMFGLLQEELQAGGKQEYLWLYWEGYGLNLPTALSGLLDGVLHPNPAKRYSIEQAFSWMESHPEMFENPVQLS